MYTGKSKSYNFIRCSIIFIIFPKVVSGPIVLYRDFSYQMKNREVSLELISIGIERIMIGFAKK